MKKIIYLLVLSYVLVSLSAVAQECKFEINQKDNVTGQTKVGFTYIVGRVSFQISKSGEQVTTQIFISYTDGTTQAVEKGQEVQMRLANGEIIKLTARERTEPQVKGAVYTEGTTVAATTVTANYTVQYDISADDLAKISKSAPIAFKLRIGKEYGNDIPEKKGIKIMDAYKCVMEYKG
jgi:hypothetical protein